MLKTLLTLTAAAVLATAANAVELVTNGSFTLTTTDGVTSSDGAVRDLTAGDTYITGWTISNATADSFALTWYYPAGTADNNTVTANVYGPGNGVANGFGLSPDGGAMVALDGAATYQAVLSQTITGLVVGNKYTLTFDWAGAQQQGFTGATTEQFIVGFGTDSYTTKVWNNPEQGFSGWFKENVTFTARDTSQVLSFLAVGTPDGQPPFSLIDGVSLTGAVPEPATWALMIAGFALVGVAARRRQALVAA